MYNNIRHKMKFGDVVAFSGKGAVSNIIKWKTGSDISHVGMVLESEFIVGEKRIVLIESTSLVNIPDLRTRELIKGVQQQHLSQRLDSYEGQAYYYELKTVVDDFRKNTMYNWLMSKHASRTPYDSVQALGSAIDLLDNMGFENKPDFSSLFCSEMVTKVLQLGDFLPSAINPSEQTPADVIAYDCFKERVQIK